MSTNFPGSVDDATTMPVVVDNVTHVLASHHNNQSDALVAVETKIGTGSSTPASGKFLKGDGAGTSAWSTIDASDVPDISATYAVVAKGVTNGDSHNHDGGDGAQIAYSSLSGTPTIPVKATGAEINTGTDDAKFATAKAITDSNLAFTSDIPVKATGAEIDTGTDDVKFATAKAIEDSNLARTTNKLSAFAATTSAELAGVISDETGSGKLVFDTSPVLVTPTLGVASATSVNKVAITAPATGSIITVAEGKTLTASNTLTLTATDGSTLAIGTGGTLGTAAYTAATDYATSGANTNLTSVYLNNTGLKVKDSNGSHGLIFKPGSDLTADKTLTVTTGDADRTLTLTGDASITGTNTGDQTLPVKATGAEVDTGTDDAKFVTSKAMEDSSYVKSTGNIATASNIANNTGTTTTVLHGNAAGAPAFGAVVEADLSLSDNTTGNVSTAKHGFAPKLSNVAGQYLDGTGNWSAPAGSGDVLGPAANTADYLPQWNGANSKTLKDGVAIPTGGLAGLTSPSFTTPSLGVASATSVNKVAITAPATSATLTISDGKTLTASNSLILAGTDGTTMTFPSTSGNVYVSGNTDVAVADGGTGASTAAAAAVNLEVIPIAGWSSLSGTWTASDTDTISINADLTSYIQKGDKLKLTNDSTVKYMYVKTAPAFAAGATTFDTLGTALVAGAITLPYVSKVENPHGFPAEFDWTPTIAGGGSMTVSDTNIIFAKYKMMGNVIDGRLYFTTTTGGTASINITFTPPATSAHAICSAGSGLVVDGGSGISGNIFFSNNTGLITVRKYDASNWGLGAGREIMVNFKEAI